MAVKDHKLDEKITLAAKAEFMEHGFRGASLRKIAARAGITTGALYTRYANKDVLFTTLVADSMKKIQAELPPIREIYEHAQASRDPEQLLAAIRAEEAFYLDILYDHYDECILFFCRSDGSSLEKSLEEMMQHKASQTVQYLASLTGAECDLRGIELILSEQFHYYRSILRKGLSREEARTCMQTVQRFLEAGWRDLFRQLL